MICEACNKDFDNKDFLKNKLVCFRCIYRESQKNLKAPDPKCRQCNQSFKVNPEVKKKQRYIYCSLKCAKEGHLIQTQNHWTKILRKRISLKFG